MRKLVMLPGPTNVPDRVMQAMLTPMINHRGPEFSELYRRILSGCQKLFQTRSEIVVLSASGTAGVDAAMESILREGDTVVVPAFGEFSSRLGDSAKYAGAKVVVPEADLGHVPTLEQIEASMKNASKIRALCVVYNETSTGVTWRHLKELGQLAKRHGALYVVDAISILGGDELPVDDLGIDVCMTGSQKCIAAPPGIALVSFSDEAKRVMGDGSKNPKSQYFDIPKYFKFAENGETPFTPALPLFFALDEALKMIEEEGLPNRIRRHEVCANAFYAAFDSLGLKAFPEPENRSRTVIGILYPPSVDDKKFRNILSEKFGILIAGGFGKLRGKMFRVGCMGEINERYVATTVDAIANCLRLSGHDCDGARALESVWQAFSRQSSAT
jgi:aspartate aminotransferase-like enzyme